MDGFRVDAVPYLFETNYTLDEPESIIEDAMEDYNYLNHTLTKDQPETYNLVLSWRKILDEYAYQFNTSEKVHFSLNVSRIVLDIVFKKVEVKLMHYSNIIF